MVGFTDTVLFLMLTLITVMGQEDLCHWCDCLPHGEEPTQAFCTDNGLAEQVFYPITHGSSSLELVYIYGIKVVNFTQGSFVTEKPVTLLIQNCSEVNILDSSVPRLRSLLIRDVKSTFVGSLDPDDLWAVVLEDIHQLSINASGLSASYSVSIGHIGKLTFRSEGSGVCPPNPGMAFTLFQSEVGPIENNKMSVCGGNITIVSNSFESIYEEGFNLLAEESIAILNNKFEIIKKQAFKLSSPLIRISDNHFTTLPAGALRDVSTIQDTFFTNNTIDDVDLGGVLLDMGWDMIIEENTIECDCASKRTSILNPKQDMLYLTNNSYEKLENIFLHNFCNLNCVVSLRAFSYALSHENVCVTNDTQLEQGVLCNITVIPDTTETENTDASKTTDATEANTSFVSAASRVQLLVPLTIILVTILITSSLCYGCKDVCTFKFVFDPNKSSVPKVT